MKTEMEAEGAAPSYKWGAKLVVQECAHDAWEQEVLTLCESLPKRWEPRQREGVSEQDGVASLSQKRHGAESGTHMQKKEVYRFTQRPRRE